MQVHLAMKKIKIKNSAPGKILGMTPVIHKPTNPNYSLTCLDFPPRVKISQIDHRIMMVLHFTFPPKHWHDPHCINNAECFIENHQLGVN